ncbi:MAG TPA: hypothetical protein VFE33_35805 [Thermoanaerobaculia bacterium]|nr:hypothetical protein [Thermoanaerobaculia bacterium]
MPKALPALLAKIAADRKVESTKRPPTVVLDWDVAEVFRSSDEVNSALRALISAVPQR